MEISNYLGAIYNTWSQRHLYIYGWWLRIRDCLDANFSSLNFRYSSLITHHSILSFWHHYSLVITQYFSHCLWASKLSLDAAFFFPIPKLTEPNEKKKKNWRPKPVKKEEEKKKEELKTKPKIRKGKKMSKGATMGPSMCI